MVNGSDGGSPPPPIGTCSVGAAGALLAIAAGARDGDGASLLAQPATSRHTRIFRMPQTTRSARPSYVRLRIWLVGVGTVSGSERSVITMWCTPFTLKQVLLDDGTKRRSGPPSSAGSGAPSRRCAITALS